MALTGLEAGRSVSAIFLSTGEALTGLGSGRSVSDLGFNSYSKERRSPGWRWEDPSRTLGLILTPRRGAHRAGVGKIRLGAGALITLRRGAHRAGVGKIRLGAGALITLRRGAHRAGREDPSRSRGFNSYSKERRSPGWGREDPSRTTIYSCSKEALTGLGSERSVSEQGL